MCAYHYAQLSYTIQQTVIIAQILCIEGDGFWFKLHKISLNICLWIYATLTRTIYKQCFLSVQLKLIYMIICMLEVVLRWLKHKFSWICLFVVKRQSIFMVHIVHHLKIFAHWLLLMSYCDLWWFIFTCTNWTCLTHKYTYWRWVVCQIQW